MNQMKIGVITIHSTNNYGAMLQAYATVEFLVQSGYDAELIDYTNAHIQEQLNLSYKQDGKIRGYFITFVRNIVFGRLYFYKKAFRDAKQLFRLSSEKYNTLEDLDKTDYDILIVGSDQVWNPQITGTLDPAFLLLFGHPQKRITLSSSLGSYVLSENDKEEMKTALQKMDYISVRENFAKRQLIDLVDKEIKILMDPTFLLSKKDWIDKLISKSQYANNQERYILTYFAGGNKSKHREIIAEYARKLNLPVWTIQYSNYTWKESSKKILGASMADFMALIKNAELVITDSFHGVALSLNMETNFVPLANTANPERVRNLLELVSLENMIDVQPEEYVPIDYNTVTRELDKYRDDSREWVKKSING